MKTESRRALDKFITRQQVYQGWLKLLRATRGPKWLIATLERDMARNFYHFLLTHTIPAILSRTRKTEPKARRTRPSAGNERAK